MMAETGYRPERTSIQDQGSGVVMAYLIGTDEAGYGPNLGPLVISLTAWRVPDTLRQRDLYDVLAGAVQRVVGEDAAGGLAIADSKQLYKPGGGLAALERGVLSCLRTLGQRESSWRNLWRCLTADCDSFLAAFPWNVRYDSPLPCDADVREIDRLSEQLLGAFTATGVTLHTMRSAVIFPDRWNDLLEAYGNKAEVLAHETLRLLQPVVDGLDAGPIVIQCDKFGGRNHYAHLLQQAFPEYLVEISREARAVSIYRWGPQQRRVECRFAAHGEEFLPTALASMISKYLRELAMLAFNHFWREQIPGLKATAGYPTDARRFKQDIEPQQRALHIDDRLVWRAR